MDLVAIPRRPHRYGCAIRSVDLHYAPPSAISMGTKRLFRLSSCGIPHRQACQEHRSGAVSTRMRPDRPQVKTPCAPTRSGGSAARCGLRSRRRGTTPRASPRLTLCACDALDGDVLSLKKPPECDAIEAQAGIGADLDALDLFLAIIAQPVSRCGDVVSRNDRVRSDAMTPPASIWH